MAVQFHNGVILFNGGQIAMHADCCCGGGGDPTCACTCARKKLTLFGIQNCCRPLTGGRSQRTEWDINGVHFLPGNGPGPEYTLWTKTITDGVTITEYSGSNCTGSVTNQVTGDVTIRVWYDQIIAEEELIGCCYSIEVFHMLLGPAGTYAFYAVHAVIPPAACSDVVGIANALTACGQFQRPNCSGSPGELANGAAGYDGTADIECDDGGGP